jgi:HEAT repeat protein
VSVEEEIERLRDPDPVVRTRAARALVFAPSAVDPLIARLQARKRYLRRAAAAALARIGDERAVEPLISLYERSTDQRVRRDVLEALAQFRAR